MPAKARYLVAEESRLAARPDAPGGASAFTERVAKFARRRTPRGRYVVELTREERRMLEEQVPHAIIEPDEPLIAFGMPELPARAPDLLQWSREVSARDANTGAPLANVTIIGVGRDISYEAVTDGEGRAELRTAESTLRHVIVSPPDTHWSRLVADVDVTSAAPLDVPLKRLLATGAYDWGQRLMGFRQFPQWTGRGVKVAVVDSGVAGDHPDLHVAGGHNALDDEAADDWRRDVNGHGTHVAGIVASLNAQLGLLGGAPGVELLCAKVLPRGRLSDLIEAIEWCVQRGVDIINLSLGSPRESVVLDMALREAYDSGITCIAAAGNARSQVAFPAALNTVIAVGALGRFGTFPEDSAHSLRETPVVDRRGELFASSFSNVGPEIDVCAPGVAVLSTVPSGYAAWDGTSMASSMVTALAAVILEACPAIRTGNAEQVEWVRHLLLSAAVDLGWSPQVQGHGLPVVARALAAARASGCAAPAYH